MITLFDTKFNCGSITCHFIKSFLGLGVAGESHCGCNDEYTIRFTCYNIKVYLGPLIFNFNFELFAKPIDIEKLFHNESFETSSTSSLK